MMKVKTLLKCSVMVVAMMLQFLVLAGIGHCQENSGETVGRKVDSNLDAAKKKLAEWEEAVKGWEAKGKKLGKDGREEYLKLKEQFLRQKDDAVAKVKDLHERRAEVTQEVSEKFDKAYKEAEKRGYKIDCVNGQNRLKSQITGGTDGHYRRTARYFDERLQETRRSDW